MIVVDFGTLRDGQIEQIYHRRVAPFVLHAAFSIPDSSGGVLVARFDDDFIFVVFSRPLTRGSFQSPYQFTSIQSPGS